MKPGDCGQRKSSKSAEITPNGDLRRGGYLAMSRGIFANIPPNDETAAARHSQPSIELSPPPGPVESPASQRSRQRAGFACVNGLSSFDNADRLSTAQLPSDSRRNRALLRSLRVRSRPTAATNSMTADRSLPASRKIYWQGAGGLSADCPYRNFRRN